MRYYIRASDEVFYTGDMQPGDREATEAEVLACFGDPAVNARVLMQQQFIAAIDSHMNAFAATRGYDSMASAASYAGDKADAVFAFEGGYAKRMRSLIYRRAYEILDDALTGVRPMPTIEEVIAELPSLEWPNEA